MSITFGGDASGVVAAVLEAQAAIDSLRGKTVTVRLTPEQIERLLELGYITPEGDRLVSWEEIWAALHPDGDDAA